MSKFDTILSKISEALPVTPQQPAIAGQPKPATTNPAQQPTIDPKIVQELIAAQNEQQVKLALQKMQAAQATQQKLAPGTQTQPTA
jgi:hypothetical protein